MNDFKREKFNKQFKENDELVAVIWEGGRRLLVCDKVTGYKVTVNRDYDEMEEYDNNNFYFFGQLLLIAVEQHQRREHNRKVRNYRELKRLMKVIKNELNK